MTLTKRAVWVIERNLAGDLSLASVARACGVTRHHLAHAFADTLGLGVGAYVRGRRLSEAAKTLALGRSAVVEAALDAGYGSHEAFTRAFRTQFGVPPGAVSKSGSTEGLALVDPAAIAAHDDEPPIAPRIVERSTTRLAGVGEPASFAAPEPIPALWRRFMPRFGGIPNRSDPIPVGVLADMTAAGAFIYVCAAEVSSFAGLAAEFRRMTLGPRTYAVFIHEAHVVTLRRTYTAIWDRWLPERGWTLAEGPLLERHNARFDAATGLGGLEIWVPIVPAA